MNSDLLRKAALTLKSRAENVNQWELIGDWRLMGEWELVAELLEVVAGWYDEGLGTTLLIERTNYPDMWNDMQRAASDVAEKVLAP